jgi:hypothetical protein
MIAGTEGDRVINMIGTSIRTGKAAAFIIKRIDVA